MEVIGLIGTGVVLFVSTNLDDIVVLISFSADPGFYRRQIILGQYLGIAVLVALSYGASLISLLLQPAYVGLLGLIPVAIGTKKLFELKRDDVALDSDSALSRGGFSDLFAVAGVTIANGGDNIGIYTPVFATSSRAAIGVYVVVFTAMTAIWLVLAHWLVNHRWLGAPIRRYSHILVPIVLIVIGLQVLYDAGSIRLISVGP